MMNRITALQLQTHNRQRVNVFLDGEFAFGLSKIVAAWLEVGQELSPEKVEALKEQDSEEVALQKALKFIGIRARSSNEIRQNLRRKGLSEDLIDKVVSRLENSRVIDDKGFARMWVENRSDHRPRGRRMLAYELKQKGIAEEIIRETLEENLPDEDELAYQAALLQSRKLKQADWAEFRKKMYDHLARRGFSYDAASLAVRRVWSERNANTL
jgi:regulatory protein